MSSGLEYCQICGNEFQAWETKDGKPIKVSDLCENCRTLHNKNIQPISSIQAVPPVRAEFVLQNIRYKVIASDRIKGVFTAKKKVN